MCQNLKPTLNKKIIHISRERVDFFCSPNTYWKRTFAIGEIADFLRSCGLISGWRNEKFPVGTSFESNILFEIERAAIPIFGLKGYGIHLNGFVKKNNTTYLWVGKRSMTKQTGPGKLDQLVAGGQPVGLSLTENLIKECKEEASIKKNLAIKAKPVNSISYMTEREEGLRNDTLFCFDIELPESFVPINTDGEVEKFFLWPVGKISQIIQETQDFKFNSAIVAIDFLIRHKFIDSNHKDFIQIIKKLENAPILRQGKEIQRFVAK